MSRALLVDAVLNAVKTHPKVNVTQAAANSIVDTFTATITETLKSSGIFTLKGFGTFRTAYVFANFSMRKRLLECRLESQLELLLSDATLGLSFQPLSYYLHFSDHVIILRRQF